MTAKMWSAAWRHDGRKFSSIHEVNDSMVGKGPHLGVSAGRCTPPTVSDGYEVCVHHSQSSRRGGGSRSPMRPILSCASRGEAQKVATLLRRCCAAWMAEGLERYDEINRRIGAVARNLGYREDHRSVWHRSGDWLDTESHTPGQTWRETGRYENAVAIWADGGGR